MAWTNRGGMEKSTVGDCFVTPSRYTSDGALYTVTFSRIFLRQKRTCLRYDFTYCRATEFLDLLPLTLALAGLPHSDHGRYFTAEQIESRLFTIRHAWKAARQVTRECIQPGSAHAASASEGGP